MTNRAMRGWYSIAARALFGMFALLTSIYCLLAYIPDLYFAFIQAPFQTWLVIFIAWHPYITEFIDIAQAPKLRAAVRTLAFIMFSCYCTLGCVCRILIQFFPERFGQDQGHI